MLFMPMDYLITYDVCKDFAYVTYKYTPNEAKQKHHGFKTDILLNKFSILINRKQTIMHSVIVCFFTF